MMVNRSIQRRFLLLLLVALIAAAVLARVAFTRDTASIGTGIVTIRTRLSYQGGEAAGTGMVLTSSGEVLTNNHVIAGATSVKVSVPGTTHSYTARVVGYNVRDDIAVLQLQHASSLKTVSIGASAKVSLGQKVTAVGNAGGSGSLRSAAGRITGTGKTITASDDQGGSETLVGQLETNAAVVAGDSGGPLLNASRNVIGIVTAASTGGGFGFEDVAASDAYAIPIGKAVKIAAAIEAGKNLAGIHLGATAFLGIQAAAVDAAPPGFGRSAAASGVVIVGVVPGGPAASAGLAAGDVITAVGGHAVNSPSTVSSIVLTKKPGAKITIRYLNATGRHTATVRLGSGPPR